jgi:hypothetical protein
VSTDLRRIGEKARKESELVFTSLFHHVTDVANLRACYDALTKRVRDGNSPPTVARSTILSRLPSMRALLSSPFFR